MKQKITGKDYLHSIESIRDGRYYCFQIRSEHKKSKRSANITNLNFILSNIVSQVMDDSKVEDSWIDTSKQKADNLFAIAQDCFENKKWIIYLEQELDEDRECGEWESNFQF